MWAERMPPVDPQAFLAIGGIGKKW